MSEDSSNLEVQLVAADRTVWSGEATEVVARTVEGDIGVLRGHAPLLSLLTPSVVEIHTDSETVVAAVDGGFISVASNLVSILAERADLAEDIDASEAESELEDAKATDDDDDDENKQQLIRAAEARIRATERAG